MIALRCVWATLAEVRVRVLGGLVGVGLFETLTGERSLGRALKVAMRLKPVALVPTVIIVFALRLGGLSGSSVVSDQSSLFEHERLAIHALLTGV